jgi:hypothetical protein
MQGLILTAESGDDVRCFDSSMATQCYMVIQDRTKMVDPQLALLNVEEATRIRDWLNDFIKYAS